MQAAAPTVTPEPGSPTAPAPGTADGSTSDTASGSLPELIQAWVPPNYGPLPGPPAGYAPPGYPPQSYGPPPGYPPAGYEPQPGYPPPGYEPQPSYPPPGYEPQPATGPVPGQGPGTGTGADDPAAGIPLGYVPSFDLGRAPGGPAAVGPPDWSHGMPTTRRSRTSRRFAVLFTVAVLVAIGAGVGIGAAIAPTNPASTARSVLNQAIAAGTAAGSFHYVEQSTGGGPAETIAGDAAPNGGSQTITQGSDQFDLRLVNGAVYFKGNASAMADQLGAPTAIATKDAGRWVSVPKSTGSLYSGFAVGITAKSNLSQINDTVEPLTVTTVGSGSGARTVVLGHMKIGTSGTAGTTRVVLNAATHLPENVSGNASVPNAGVTETVQWSFDHWHQHVSVSAPSGALPYSSLGATPPSSGGSAPSAGSTGA